MISLIVGLGNPGDEYKKTRHNAGFLLLDALANKYNVSFSYESKFKAELAKCLIEGRVVRLIKPQAYMNKSGFSVRACASYFEIPIDQILVVHDELDIAPGLVRLKLGGGHGGHNGLRDIIANMSTKDFYRLRIGIGHPGDRNKVVNYVLKAPGKVDSQLLEEVIEDVINEVPAICRGEYQTVMQHLHGKKL